MVGCGNRGRVGGGGVGGGITDSQHGRSAKTKLTVTKCVILGELLRIHLNAHSDTYRAGSSIARSGPALNPLPAAWNGWRQIPALRPPLSKRNGGREGQGEMEG